MAIQLSNFTPYLTRKTVGVVAFLLAENAVKYRLSALVVTIQYQQGSINLAPQSCVFQAGIGGADVAIPGAIVTPLPLNDVLISDPLLQHTPGDSVVTFLATGFFLAAWHVSVGVTSGGRKNSQTVLFFDGGSGFFPIPETFGYGYHRNIAAGRDTTSASFQRTVSSGDSIMIASQRIAGTGNLEFLASSCLLRVAFIPSGN